MPRPNPAPDLPPARRSLADRAVTGRQPRPLSDNEAFAARLAGLNHRCPQCDYSLKGIAANICPECGLELTQSRLACPVAHWCRAPFFVGIAGIAVAFLPLAFAAFIILRAATVAGRADAADRFNLVLLGGTAVCLGATFARWVNWSGIMAAWTRPRHWLYAVACWALPAVTSGVAFLIGARL